MAKDTTKALGNVIHIDDERIRDHLGKIVRGSVEETLNAFGGRELREKLRDITKGGVEEKGGLGLNRDA